MLKQNIAKVRARIDAAATAAEREGHEVSLELAVKTRSTETILTACEALQDAGLPLLLGHNHVQEAQTTVPVIRVKYPTTEIHMIGHLQKNKINKALENVDLIETIDTTQLLEAVAKRVPVGRILPIYIEVNTSGEAAKSGVQPGSATLELAAAAVEHDNLSLAGLMTVGAITDSETVARSCFDTLAEMREKIDSSLELSMGMSQDMEWAIKSGATIVRIGTDVFGPRDYR